MGQPVGVRVPPSASNSVLIPLVQSGWERSFHLVLTQVSPAQLLFQWRQWVGLYLADREIAGNRGWLKGTDSYSINYRY